MDNSNGWMGIGLLGLGTVGGAVARLLAQNREDVARRAGCELRPVAALVKNTAKPRGNLPPGLAMRITADAAGFFCDPSVRLVVDATGGLEPARSYVVRALESGRPVVTANKQLLATCGRELFAAAARGGVDLLFEASVCSGVPVLRVLREGLAGDRIRRVTGVLNGTTNFVLTLMEGGAPLCEAVKEAQTMGYAEADPRADLDGYDAAWKLAILASIAFGRRVLPDLVSTRGLDGVTGDDLMAGLEAGFRLKLLATARASEDGAVEARVEPMFVSCDHPLAQAEGAENVVLLSAVSAGPIVLRGLGAGGDSAAAAIVSDLIEAARNLQQGVTGRGCGCRGEASRLQGEPPSAGFLHRDGMPLAVWTED